MSLERSLPPQDSPQDRQQDYELIDQFNQEPVDAPSSHVALGGLKLVLGNFKQQILENTVTNLEGDLENLTSRANDSARVHSNTATAQLLPKLRSTGGVSQDAEKRIVTSLTSSYSHKDKAGNEQPSLRPVTKSEIRKRRRNDRRLHRNMRFAMVNDLAHLREGIDPASIGRAETKELPDRRPEIGNKETRQNVDELLRRKGLLNDRPPQESTPPVPINTKEHKLIVDSGRHTPRERREIRKTSVSASRNQRKINKGINKIQNHSQQKTFGQRIHEIRHKHIEKRLEKTKSRLAKTKEKNEVLRQHRS